MPYDPEDCIAAPATPWAASALAVIRTSGDGSLERVAGVFSRPEALHEAKSGTIVHGYVVDPDDGERIDEVTALVYRKPHGYTGEDAVEIVSHGSLPGIKAILDALGQVGFRRAQPGEFTFRAFLSGKIDLTRAEAVREIVESKSDAAHRLALHRLSGNLQRRMHEVKRRLIEVTGRIELNLDYPEDEVHETEPAFDAPTVRGLSQELQRLESTYKVGRIYQEGITIVIAGATNAGKSSLFNLFLKEDRAIVSETHGTTRDYIESWITIDGVPIRLYDTAGLRATTEQIEGEGIRRTRELAENCDCVIYLVDSSKGIGSDEEELVESLGRERVIMVWSKCDIERESAPDGFIAVSAETGTGFEVLEAEVAKRFARVESVEGGLVIESEHQRQCLHEAAESLDRALAAAEQGLPLDAIATDVSDALRSLGELTGEVTPENILESIFQRFCVGK